MCEQKFEQEQCPLTPGKKILWFICPEDEQRSSGDLSALLENVQTRIVYNNLRSCDEVTGWENTRCDTPEAIFSRIEDLQSGDCYILDSLELVCCPRKADFNSELVSFGKKLFQRASSCGVDCIIIASKRSQKVMEKLQLPMPSWLQELKAAADIVFEDATLQPSSPAVGDLFQLHLQI